ncbi:MAG: hypothetical protein IPM64_12980 [Phycisphaerales bacterium]|nr:hypothetical protein [Phycisphaerales bacterium]
MKHRNVAVSSLIIALIANASAGAPVIIDLGSLGPNSTSFSRASGISANGTIVVGSTEIADGTRRGFRYTYPGPMQLLDSLPGGLYADAEGLSADGAVVIGTSLTSTPTVHGRIVRWTTGSTPQNIGNLADGGGAFSGGCSANGAVVCGTTPSTFASWRAVRWSHFTGLVDISPASMLYSGISAVSDDGSLMVGFGLDVSGIGRAFLLPAGGSVQILPSLNGYAHALGLRISGSGDVVAGVSRPSLFIAAGDRATRWVLGDPHDLGLLNGFTRSSPAAMHRGGLIIGGESGGAVDGAWIWTETRGMVRLSTFLAEAGTDLTGWSEFQSVTGISDAGTELCGTGVYNGAERAFLVRGLDSLCGPWITQPPVNTDVCHDSVAALQCDAFGPTFFMPAFQWFRLGTSGWEFVNDGPTGSGMTISGAQSPTLTFHNVRSDAETHYVVQVTADCGSLTTSPVFVRYVEGAPVFADDAIPPIACSHGSVTMNAYPGPVQYGPFAVKWQRETAPASNVWVDLANGSTTGWDGNNAGIGGIVSGATTTSLTITADTANGRQLSTAHQRGYRCVATNACGSASYAKYLNVVLVGDANCDDSINSFDIDLFVEWVFNSNFIIAPASYVALGGTQDCWDQRGCWADLNHDSVANNFDIDGFVACIVSTPPAGRPCP